MAVNRVAWRTDDLLTVIKEFIERVEQSRANENTRTLC